MNLSPANLRKESPGLDLPIALGVLAASRQVPAPPLDAFAFAGELSLKGDLVPTPGVLAVAIAVARSGLRGVVVPEANAAEAMLVEGIEVVPAPTLTAVAAFVRGSWVPRHDASPPYQPPNDQSADVDFEEVRGQGVARRALEVAAAGGHNALMVGPPGAGKTMLARRLPTILPQLTRTEALEVTRLHSVAGLLTNGGLVASRPFRAPHHSISPAALLGGGTGSARPGEVSLAHHGVLFLDEVTEFRRDALEGLRQPLEDGRVVVGRASGTLEFPARFTLLAASNPCPCGFQGDGRRACACLPNRALAYQQRLSGPMLDRVDIQLSVPRLSRYELLGSQPGEPSRQLRQRVEEARARQRKRFEGTPWTCNAHIPGSVARREARLYTEAEMLLSSAVETLTLSGRSFDRALKVARTIADLEAKARVGTQHVSEALGFRALGPATEVLATA